MNWGDFSEQGICVVQLYTFVSHSVTQKCDSVVISWFPCQSLIVTLVFYLILTALNWRVSKNKVSKNLKDKIDFRGEMVQRVECMCYRWRRDSRQLSQNVKLTWWSLHSGLTFRDTCIDYRHWVISLIDYIHIQSNARLHDLWFSLVFF